MGSTPSVCMHLYPNVIPSNVLSVSRYFSGFFSMICKLKFIKTLLFSNFFVVIGAFDGGGFAIHNVVSVFRFRNEPVLSCQLFLLLFEIKWSVVQWFVEVFLCRLAPVLFGRRMFDLNKFVQLKYDVIRYKDH